MDPLKLEGLEPMKFKDLVDFINHRAELGELPRDDTSVMAISPEGLPMSLKAVEIEDHEEGGGQTIWLHVEEF